MTESTSARFRSATEFPQTIQSLDRIEADALYTEMRECLIFTNRSRAQLIRRNQEHKAKTGLLKEDVQRLQGMIRQLTAEKQQISQQQQGIITALEAEMIAMVSHLDELSIAFDGVADVETAEQAHWSILAMPSRFLRFLQAVKAVVMWWQSDRPSSPALPSVTQPTPPVSESEDTEDRRDRPQMYEDQASINRSLLDR